MPDQPKISFQLTAREKRLEVRVTAPGGETRGEADLPDASLLDELTTASAATGKLPSSLTEKAGKALYNTLVSESVDELVIDSLNDTVRANTPLLFELRFDADQIALTQYPWELIQNAQGQFLVRDGLVDLTRYITYPQPPPSFDNTIKGLPLFRVISSPTQLPPLTSGNLKITPIDTLDNATFDGFMRRLLIDRLKMWGLHFDGHGALALQCASCDALNGPADTTCWSCKKSLADAKKVGALAFQKGGEVAWIPAGEFGSVLYNAQARLALLLACETAKVGNQIVFSGLAPGLLLAGVPAVIGMQYPILDTFAGSFANEFYGALLKENDILTAMRVARRMNMLDAWYSPALYLRRQPTQAEVAKQAVFLTRNIDTAAPAKVSAGATFLTRLWIRRPETKPLSAAKLRAELDIPKDIPVKQAKGEAEVKFEPVAGRKLRRGEVEVQVSAKDWEIVSGDVMKLFIDETLDAPPAIFTIKAKSVGKQPLMFSVSQDGGVIHTVTHVVEAVEDQAGAMIGELAEHSGAVNVDDKKAGAVAGGVGAGAAEEDKPKGRRPVVGRLIDRLEGVSPEGEVPKTEEPSMPAPEQSAPPPQAQPMPASPAPVTSSPPPPPQTVEQPAFGGVPKDQLSEEETQAGDKTDQWSPSDETQVGRRPPGAPPAAVPPPMQSPDYEMPTQVGSGSGSRDSDDRARQEQQGQQEYQSPPPEKPIAAPSQAPRPMAPLPRKSGPPIAPILIIGALGLAAIVIGAIIVIGGLLGGDRTPPPPPVDTEPPPVPQVVSPNGDKLVCNKAVTFVWAEVSDPSGIASYEVVVQQLVRDQWQEIVVQQYAKPGVNLLLDCIQQENSVRWKVRATDQAGNVSGYSQEAEFLLFIEPVVVTEAPPETVIEPTVVPTPPAFQTADITNMPEDGYDWGSACGDITVHVIDLQAILYDPDGYDDVHVEVHYAVFDPNYQQVGPEVAMEMLSQGGGYYFANIDVQNAARSVKYSATYGEIRMYLMAFDSTGTQVFYPSEFGDRMIAPIYYCIG